MISIRQDHLGTGLAHLIRKQAFDRALSADRHECRRLHLTMWQ
jgi:hypothetical protein